MLSSFIDQYRQELRKNHLDKLIMEKRQRLLNEPIPTRPTSIESIHALVSQTESDLLSAATRQSLDLNPTGLAEHPLLLQFVALHNALKNCLIQNSPPLQVGSSELWALLLNPSLLSMPGETPKIILTLLVNLSFCSREIQPLNLGSWVNSLESLGKGVVTSHTSEDIAELLNLWALASTFLTNLCLDEATSVLDLVKHGLFGLLARWIGFAGSISGVKEIWKFQVKAFKCFRIILVKYLQIMKSDGGQHQEGLDNVVKFLIERLKFSKHQLEQLSFQRLGEGTDGQIKAEAIENYEHLIEEVTETLGSIISFSDQLMRLMAPHQHFENIVKRLISSKRSREIILGYKFLGVISYVQSELLGNYLSSYDVQVLIDQLNEADANATSNILWTWENMLLDDNFGSICQAMLMTPTAGKIPFMDLAGAFLINQNIPSKDACAFIRNIIYTCLPEYQPALVRGLGHLVTYLDHEKGPLLLTILQSVRRSNLLPQLSGAQSEITSLEEDEDPSQLFVNPQVQSTLVGYYEQIQDQRPQASNVVLKTQMEVQEVLDWIEGELAHSEVEH